MSGKITLKQLLEALALFCAVGAVGRFFFVMETAVPLSIAELQQRESYRAPASSEAAQVSEQIRFKLEAGSRYTYSFDRAVRVSGLGASQGEIPEIRYSGKFYVDVIQADTTGFDAWVSEQVEHFEEPSPIAFKIHVDAAGKNLSLSAPELASDRERQHAGILKDLVSNWLFPLESDTIGAYIARFEPMTVSGGIARLKKHKIAYVKSPTKKAPVPEIVASVHQADWDLAHGLPILLRGQEQTKLGASGPGAAAQMGFSSDASYKIAFVSVGPRPQMRASGTFHSENLALTPDSTTARARSRFTAADWPKLLQRLNGLASLSSPEQLALFGDLAALLRVSSQGLSSLTGMLSPGVIAAGPGSALFKVAVGALATAGTPEAQQALLQIYQDPNCAEAGKGTILAALTTTQAQLTSQTRDFLLNETQNEDTDLSNGAEWALGSALANAPSDTSAQNSIASIHTAWSTAQAASEPEPEQLVLLDAMGNSGNANFLPIVSGVIGGEGDLTLKSTAVYALRFMSDPGAITLMSQELGDPNAAIRLAAANAMQSAPWNATFQAPLQQCASGDSNTQVQAACQQALKNAGT